MLIHPCECTGSCKFIHLKCLKDWVEMKTEVTIRDYCVCFKKINCEICKSEFPLSLIVEGRTEEVLLMERPKCDYLMLEKLSGGPSHILILKNLPMEGLSIGRGASCYLKLSGNTISRQPHAFIQYRMGDFYVLDNESKFGTAVVEDPLSLEIGKTARAVQIGNTLLTIAVKKESKILQDL
jgi:hypothetical protein